MISVIFFCCEFEAVDVVELRMDVGIAVVVLAASTAVLLISAPVREWCG